MTIWENIKAPEAIEVRVRGFGILKDLITDSSFSLKKGTALSGLLERMMERYAESFQNIILDQETKQVHSFICILLNGNIVEDLNKELRGNDEVTLFVPVSGG